MNERRSCFKSSSSRRIPGRKVNVRKVSLALSHFLIRDEPLYDQHAHVGALSLKRATNIMIKPFSFSPAPLSSGDTRLNRPPSLCARPELRADRDDLLASLRSRV